MLSISKILIYFLLFLVIPSIGLSIPDDGNRGASSSSKSSGTSSSSKSSGTSSSSSTRGGLESSKSSSAGSGSSKSSSPSSSSSKSSSPSNSSTGKSTSSTSQSSGSDRDDRTPTMTKSQASQYTSSMQTSGSTGSKTSTTAPSTGSKSSSPSMTKGEASKFTSSMQSDSSNSNASRGGLESSKSNSIKTSETMTKGQASKYTSNMQPNMEMSSSDIAAKKAGNDYMSKYTTGTIGAGSFGYQLAQERLQYKGVENYYKSNNIKGGMVPTGPMAAKYGNYAVANDPILSKIDEDFKRGTVTVVTAGSKTSEQHMRELIGTKVYDQLTKTQKFGLYNSDIAIGNLSQVINDPLTGGYYDPATNRTLIDLNSELGSTQDGLEKVAIHELQHAGDFTTYERAKEIANDPKATAEQKQLAEETMEFLGAVINGYVYENVSEQKPNNSTAFTFDTPSEYRAQKYKEYLSDVAEVRSFSSTPSNRSQWATGFALTAGISVPEALEVLDAMAEEEGILDDNSLQNQFIDSLGK